MAITEPVGILTQPYFNAALSNEAEWLVSFPYVAHTVFDRVFYYDSINCVVLTKKLYHS